MSDAIVHQCMKMVSFDDGFRKLRCPRKAVTSNKSRRTGNITWYCHQHDPKVVAKRKEKQAALHRKQMDASRIEWTDKAVGSWMRQFDSKRYAAIDLAIRTEKASS